MISAEKFKAKCGFVRLESSLKFRGRASSLRKGRLSDGQARWRSQLEFSGESCSRLIQSNAGDPRRSDIVHLCDPAGPAI